MRVPRMKVSVSLPTPGFGDRVEAGGDTLASVRAEVIMDDSAPDRSKRCVNERIDIRVGVERRRRWGREDKLRIVRESLAPNAVVTELARQYEISTSLLYTWRKQALAGLLEGFTPVRIVSNAEASTLPAIEEVKDTTGKEINPIVRRSGGLIEVVWPNGIVVRVDADVDDRALNAVLAALGAK
jgi:Transposase and inactivated derivatives